MAEAVFVIGGSRGIGRELVQRLARRECPVVYASRQPAKALPDVPWLPCDVRQPDQLATAFTVAEALLPALDVVVFNAAVAPTGLLVGLSEATIDEVLDVNMRAVLASVRAAEILFARLQRVGRLVLVGSVAATGMDGAVLYAASKAALRGLLNAQAGHWLRLSLVELGLVTGGLAEQTALAEPFMPGGRCLSLVEAAQAIEAAFELPLEGCSRASGGMLELPLWSAMRKGS